jgi:hypothetical protein
LRELEAEYVRRLENFRKKIAQEELANQRISSEPENAFHIF